jgi:hypothetical protein
MTLFADDLELVVDSWIAQTGLEEEAVRGAFGPDS